MAIATVEPRVVSPRAMSIDRAVDVRWAVAAAVLYPALMFAVDAAIVAARAGSALAAIAAASALVAAILPSVLSARELLRVGRFEGDASSKALLTLVFTVPSLFTGLVTLSSAAGSRAAIVPAWLALWALLTVLLHVRGTAEPHTRVVPGWLRRTHGWMAAALLVAFIGAHMLSHLTALWSVPVNAAVMSTLRGWYRAGVVETVILALFAGMMLSGARMLWIHLGRAADRFRVVQLLTGIYLAVFLCSHVFATMRARSLDTDTDWAFAAGPAYTLLDGSLLLARLIPHYFMAVAVIGVHLAAGLRSVALAHGKPPAHVNRVFFVLSAIAVAVSLSILAALLGVHVSGA